MSRALTKFFQLPRAERRQLVALMMLQPLTSVSLRLSGFKKTLSLIERLSRHPQPRTATQSDLQQADRLAHLSAIAGQQGPITTTCLRQALVVHGLLRRHGLQPELRFGVGVLDTTPEMHAWVELDGVPLAQPKLRHRGFRSANLQTTTTPAP